MDGVSQAVPEIDELFHACRSSRNSEYSARVRKALAASVALHVAAVVLLPYFPASVSPRREAGNILAGLRNPARLVAPPEELTQRPPNSAKPSKEFDLEGLLPRPSLKSPPGPPSTTRPAARIPLPPTPDVALTPALPEPPKIDVRPGEASQLPLIAQGLSPSGPPQIQTEEKPKLAFERPGVQPGAAREPGGLRPPAGSISEITRELARGGRAGGMIVGDLGEGVGGLGEGLNLPPSPGRTGSSLELLSDPKGVDFRPYLIRILSAVRRNWFAVIPESARMGRQGKVVIQFAISRDGNVPKLVIASPSGTLAFDRAAVAGVSASSPFPPLPGEFQGLSVRLQFVFLYNMR